MSILSRWRPRVTAREGLLRRAIRAKDAGRIRLRRSQLAKARRVVERAERRRSDSAHGGSRYYTNKAIDIVNGRADVTSRKRARNHPLSRANPGSDHSGGNPLADAVDFGIAEAHALKNELSRRLGGPSRLADFGTFTTRHGGHTFRHQIIAGTHGTGPHLHYGVKRVS